MSIPPFITTLLKQSRRQDEMDWIHPRRRDPEWKQGWTGQTLPSIAAPPLPLLAISAIVVFLLSLSHYATYKELMQHTTFNLKILLFLVPVILIFLLRSSLLSSWGWWLDFWSSPQQQGRWELGQGRGAVASFPWGVALVLVALLVLLSYQSSFQSKWSPFGSSDY